MPRRQLHQESPFLAIPVNKASVIVTFADSSWANAAKHSSQFGVMLVLCPPQVTEVISNCHVLDWKSGRSARICRSTLAAEACAADEGNDRACYINMVMTELLHKQPAYKGEMRLRALHTTDAKSLYDALVGENVRLSEKRATMNIRKYPAGADSCTNPLASNYTDGSGWLDQTWPEAPR